MISAFIGCMDEELITTPISGTGKTCSMVGFAYLDYLENKTVWSNFKTTFSKENIGMQEMINKIASETIDYDLILLVTEMKKILNSCGSTLNEILFIENFVSQMRKVGGDKGSVELLWDDQRFYSIQKRLRIYTDTILIPYKTHTDNSPCYNAKCKDDHRIYVYSHKPYLENPIIIFDALEVGKLYNTYEISFDKLDIPRKKKGEIIND